MADACFLHETDEPEIYVQRRNTASGDEEPATGLSLRVTYASTPGGAAIDASLTKAMTERTSAPGVYYATILGSDKAAHLTVGTTIYRRYDDGPVDLDSAHPMLVTEVRTI